MMLWYIIVNTIEVNCCKSQMDSKRATFRGEKGMDFHILIDKVLLMGFLFPSIVSWIEKLVALENCSQNFCSFYLENLVSIITQECKKVLKNVKS